MASFRVPATYMRGGTSKGVFFNVADLPSDVAKRDAILLRVIGSPDRYERHIDGMGGATSSTSKVVLVSRSQRADCDVEYLFGQLAVNEAAIDWSGNCGNLTAAVGPYAIAKGLIAAPANGIATIRMYQQNIAKRIIAHVPMSNGQVQEDGDFTLDGVTFPSARIALDFIDPAGGSGAVLFPSPGGATIERLEVNGEPQGIEASLINAGNATVIIEAAALGLNGTEGQAEINGNSSLLERCERIRAAAAVRMGLARTPEEATRSRPATPKLAWIAPPAAYVASDGKKIAASDVDLLTRIMSMGKLHHALTGTGSVALAVASSVGGTLASRMIAASAQVNDDPGREWRFGHPSGVIAVGAVAERKDGKWLVEKAVMSRSARILMDGHVQLPREPG